MSITIMNSSLVFPVTNTTTTSSTFRFPKHYGPLSVSNYSTLNNSSSPSTWYRTALTTTSQKMFSTTVRSRHSELQKKASTKRSKATTTSASIHRAPSATMMKRSSAAQSLLSPSSQIVPKLLPASLPLQVGVGMASAAYWRGMWYILDDNLYPEDGAKSALASLGLGTLLLSISQPYLFDTTAFCKHKMDFMWPKTETLSKTQAVKKYLALYGLGTSCILIWRGAWVGCDVLYEHFTGENPLDPKHLTYSGLASHGLALVAMIAINRLHCVLGPPYHGSLTYKDHDMLNTKNLTKMAKRGKAKVVLPLMQKGSREYNKLMEWLPEKAFSPRKI